MSPVHFQPPPASPGRATLRTGRIYLWVPRPLIVDLHYLAEGYEGLLISSTLDRRMGLVMVTFAPQGREEAQEVVRAILETYPGIKRAEPAKAPPAQGSRPPCP